MRQSIVAIGVALLLIGVTGCASSLNQRNAATTASLIGAGAGAIIGHQFGDGGRDKGAMIGALTGAAAGMAYGQKQDEIDGRRNGAGYQSQSPYRQQKTDSFRDPYKVPDQRYCNGRWTWDARSGYWLCQ